MPPLTRRSFLLGTGSAALLAACGGSDDDSAATTTTAPAGGGGADVPVLGVTFDVNGLLVAGIPQRAPFLLFERAGGLLPVGDAPAELTLEIHPPSGEVETVTVARHGDDVDRAYYPLVTTFSETGLHEVRAEVGGGTLEQSLNVNEADAVAVPQVGQPLPSFATPTAANLAGVQTICTRETPCPFHDVSVDEALAAGRPLALLVSTPAYCQVAICGPVLDLLITEAPSFAGVAVVHLEVYPNGAPPQAAPTPVLRDALGLTYEPVLFVADATGAVTARLDNIYDGEELRAALSSA